MIKKGMSLSLSLSLSLPLSKYIYISVCVCVCVCVCATCLPFLQSSPMPSAMPESCKGQKRVSSGRAQEFAHRIVEVPEYGSINGSGTFRGDPHIMNWMHIFDSICFEVHAHVCPRVHKSVLFAGTLSAHVVPIHRTQHHVYHLCGKIHNCKGESTTKRPILMKYSILVVHQPRISSTYIHHSGTIHLTTCWVPARDITPENIHTHPT